MKLCLKLILTTLLAAGCSRPPPEVSGQLLVSSTTAPLDDAAKVAEATTLDALARPLTPPGQRVEVLAIRNTTLLEVRVRGGDPQKRVDTSRQIMDAYIALPRPDRKVRIQVQPTVPTR
jgi:hypothetical protein